MAFASAYTETTSSYSSTVYIIPVHEDAQKADESPSLNASWDINQIPATYLYSIVGTIGLCVMLFCLVFCLKIMKRQRTMTALKGITVVRYESEKTQTTLKPATPTVQCETPVMTDSDTPNSGSVPSGSYDSTITADICYESASASARNGVPMLTTIEETC